MGDRQGSIFVTGSSGFVGRQVVRQLSQDGYQVRALLRRVPRTPFDPTVETVTGDLSKPETYAAALDGVSAVVHAALTDDLSHEPRATSALQKLSAEAGVRKFIHLSSIVVYGNPLDGTITEETPPIRVSDAYSRTKVLIEEAVRACGKVPEVAMLRLGCVYGPGGGWWSEGLLNQMERGKLILVNGGTGIANLIHVADIGAIISLLLARSNAPFGVFNVTDGIPVTWQRYYSELEKIVGRKATASMTEMQAREYGRKWLHPSMPRRLIRKISDAEITYPLDDHGIETYASLAVYSNEKARTTLGFKPAYDLESGIETLRRWRRKPAIPERREDIRESRPEPRR
jgi:nucleoside-diphosphate-sugar epimerase